MENYFCLLFIKDGKFSNNFVNINSVIREYTNASAAQNITIANVFNIFDKFQELWRNPETEWSYWSIETEIWTLESLKKGIQSENWFWLLWIT